MTFRRVRGTRIFMHGVEVTSSAAVAALVVSCWGKEPYPAELTQGPSDPYGWSHEIVEGNTSLDVSQRLGRATSMIAGHSVRDIVTNPSVRVRGDDKSCVSCHAWATMVTRTEFCNRYVPVFLALPTSAGKPSDPASAKPQLLKDLLDEWRARGCPD
ncbi:hypothetical protein [Pendulispora albinea]|uniref:Uncharacterized protein n=1 Tax=Pendulispora albinea TaxID=2741071 RepID=A0ABZ2LT01_9BACT